jgi:hypothetical protein
MAEKFWLLNHPTKTKPRRAHKKRKRNRPRNKKKENPFMARSRKRRKSYRRNPANPFKARRSHRRYRRNPPDIKGALYDVGYGAAGVVATSFASKLALQFAPQLVNQPGYAGIAVQVGIAYLAAFLGGKLLGEKAFTPMFVGGSAPAIASLVNTLTPAASLSRGGMGNYSALPSPRRQEVVL